MAVGRNVKIFVADWQVTVIWMYDEAGNFLRNLVRVGQDPVEYLGVGGMRTFPDSLPEKIERDYTPVRIKPEERF